MNSYHCIYYHQFGGKRVYLYTSNSNQLGPFASEATNYVLLDEWTS